MSRTVPNDARQEWPYGEGGNQEHGGHGVPGSEYGDVTSAPDHDSEGYGQTYEGQAYDGQAYEDHDAAGYGQEYDSQGYEGHANGAYDDQGYGQAYEGQGYDPRGFGPGDPGYGPQGYGPQGYGPGNEGYADQPAREYEQYPDYAGPSEQGYPDQHYADHGYPPASEPGYPDQQYADHGYPPASEPGYADQQYADDGYAAASDQGYPPQAAWLREARAEQAASRQEFQGPIDGPGGLLAGPQRGRQSGAPGKRKHFRRLRRFSRRPSVRVIAAIFAVFFVWVTFSAGQAAFQNNGQGWAANLAEWARDHHLGPIVTFGEWMAYNPPKDGGEPTFAYTVPKGEQLSPVRAQGRHHGFVPDIPPTVKSLASGPARSGEGQWRVVEKVKGEPAILITFLRDGGQYTSYSNGIASMDQRLVRFSLRPGYEDPGSGNWGVPDYIPSGHRTGLLATFNGGFKLDAAGGGFYLNGSYHGSLVNGAASIVYYKNGSIKIGVWGRDFTMNSKIAGVRQNLKLLVDHGKISSDANSAVKTPQWGATLGGGYWVWRSGIGITKDGRVIFVYGEKLDAQDLAQLLRRAGAVEGMQMDINPAWMKYDYYKAGGHPSNPTPETLLPSQQPNPYSYYSPSTRDFTAVYAR